LNEPFIQKYLKSLAVHVCTVPITQVVSVTIALFYVLTHPEMPRSQSWAVGAGIIALFQVVPVSPGSLVRGLYVLYLVIRERNFKDYNIAVFLGFFKYIGYLAFPIQMAYRYPVLARFMAGHWATEAVHMVPVFGERGALLERWVFCLFYNWPLTIGRRVKARLETRAKLNARYWHLLPITLLSASVFGAADYLFFSTYYSLPTLKQLTVFMGIVPLIFGSLVTLGCGGASMGKRVMATVLGSISLTLIITTISAVISHPSTMNLSDLARQSVWKAFIMVIVSVIGLVLTELCIPDPQISPLESS
jgi:hypothetical protein